MTDAGGYYVQAVNEKNGENKTSPSIHLSVESEYSNCRKHPVVLSLQTVFTKPALIKRTLLMNPKDGICEGGQLFLVVLEHTELLVQ